MKLTDMVFDGRAAADNGNAARSLWRPSASPKTAPQCRLDIAATAFVIEDASALYKLQLQECWPIL
jgi:hypothetical protein